MLSNLEWLPERGREAQGSVGSGCGSLRMRHSRLALGAGDEVRGPGSEVVGTMRDVSLSKFPILKQCSRCGYASIPGLLRTFY